MRCNGGCECDLRVADRGALNERSVVRNQRGSLDDQLMVQLALPVLGRVRSLDTLAAESVPEYPISRAALAAATASASVICAFTITMKSFVSLVPLEVMVAVKVTGKSPVTGCVTFPAAEIAGSLGDHEIVQLSAPVVGKVRSRVTVVSASPGW